MNALDIIRKIESAGFHLQADGDDIIVSPAGLMTDQQKDWLRQRKPDILDALRSEAAILDAGQSGNDIAPANDDDRALIHVPDLGLADGRRISCDMSVPVKNLERLRSVVRFTLKDGQGGGSLLGSPGKSEAELREILEEKYSGRLASINGAEVMS